jgi:glycosyltransferase involved in cell wall biosynthesis
MARPELGIVIPALNEAASVAAVVSHTVPYGTVIVVDDGSTDETGKIAASAGAEVVTHQRNMGYDRAINSGFERAAALGCSAVVTMDADGQHNPQLLEQFRAELERGADVVVGIRDRQQRLAEHVFGWVSRRLWRIRDPLCGMKAYRIEVYRKLGHFDSYGSIGTELAIFAAVNGYTLAQIPVKTRDRVGTPRFGRLLRANWLIFRAMLFALGTKAQPRTSNATKL